MTVKPLSAITPAASNIGATDNVVGVRGGTSDLLFSFAQLQGGLGAGGGGSLPLFPTSAEAQAAIIPDSTNFVMVAGNTTPGDGGAANFQRVSSLPPRYIGLGSGVPIMVPPSFSSGGVPTLCYATVTHNGGAGPLAVPISAGCLTILAGWGMVTVTPTITDSVGNVYNLAVQAADGEGHSVIYYNANPVFAPIGTTFSFPPSTTFNMRVYTFPTFKGAVLDQTATQITPGATTGSSITSPSLTGSPELVFAMTWVGASAINTLPGTAYVLPPGWTDVEPPLLSFRNAAACIIANGTAPVAFTLTWPAVLSFTATSILATFKTFPQTALDASFWQLIPPVPLHTRHFGVDPKAPDNVAQFQNFSQYLATTAAPSGGVGAERAGTPSSGTVTISIANPAVITVTLNSLLISHNLRNGMMISFQTTGALPTGIVANKIYYVLYGTVTPTSFQITSTPLFNGASDPSIKGTPIATTGTQSGTHSYTTYGESWTEFVWDPGVYAASNNMAPGINCGLKKTRILAYGARIATNVNFFGGADRDLNNDPGTNFCYNAQFVTSDIDSTGVQPGSITLITPAQATHFYVNSWVALKGVNMQNNAGGNSNPSTFEYLKIKSVDPVGGVITFYEPLQYNYRSTYPKFTVTGVPAQIDGPGTIVQLNDIFDQELEIRGLNIFGVTEGALGGMLTVRLIDCEIYGWSFDSGPSPVNVRQFTMERCNFHNCVPEVDKMIDRIEYIDCVFDQGSFTRVQSACVNKMLVERCKMMSSLGMGAKDTVIKDSFVTGTLGLGTVYGSTDRLTLINSYIGAMQDGQQEGSLVFTSTVTFTNGTLSVPAGGTTTYGTWLAPGGPTGAICPLPWAVPGGKIIIGTNSSNVGPNATVNVAATMGMLKAFTVLDVYMDGSNAFSVDTDLAAFPDTAITVTGTVSGTTLTVTAVTPSDAYPLVAMTITGGTLPAGTTITAIPGIPGSNLGAYTLNNAASISTSTVFTVALVMFYEPHSCSRLTVINCTGGRTVADMAGAPPDIPFYSYFQRAFAGNPIVATSGNERLVRLAGNLIYWQINVLRPYTGAAATYTANITMFGYKTAGGKTYPTFLNQVVNLKTAGIRRITATGVTGNVTGDTIVAVPFWLTGAHAVFVGPTAGGGDTLAVMPYFTMTAQTDQGIYPSMTVNAHSGLDEFSDTIIKANALW